jgi:hypothetical protein
MADETANPKKFVVAGWIVSAIPALMLLSGFVNILMKGPSVVQGMAHSGFSESILLPIAIIEFVCAVVYLIPKTAFFGTVLMTAYFGGAVVTHVRIGEVLWVVPVVFSVITWIGLYLREPRFRAYLNG